MTTKQKRHGIYVRDIPAEEIREVGSKLGISPEAVIGILLRPYEGGVAKAVSRYVVEQLGLFEDGEDSGEA